ncbi:unnamed protein product, partial [Cladocopium goreaui]
MGGGMLSEPFHADLQPAGGPFVKELISALVLLAQQRFEKQEGQAAQCESLVPLLRYYFAEGNLKEEHLQTHLKSFEDLAMCCAHLRALRYQWSEIAHQDVDSLLAVQERHQK